MGELCGGRILFHLNRSFRRQLFLECDDVSISRSSERPGEEGQVLTPAQALALSPHCSALGKNAYSLARRTFTAGEVSSGVEFVPSMCKDLGLIPNTPTTHCQDREF